MADLGVFNFGRIFARSASLRHPATEARTAIGADFYFTNKKRFQGSMVDIELVVKGKNCFEWELVLCHLCGVPSPALYAIALGSLPRCLRGCQHGILP
jgi:hypothetical protein